MSIKFSSMSVQGYLTKELTAKLTIVEAGENDLLDSFNNLFSQRALFASLPTQMLGSFDIVGDIDISDKFVNIQDMPTKYFGEQWNMVVNTIGYISSASQYIPEWAKAILSNNISPSYNFDIEFFEIEIKYEKKLSISASINFG